MKKPNNSTYFGNKTMQYPKLLVVILTTYLSLSGCAAMKEQFPSLGAAIGATTCAFGINQVADNFGYLGRSLASLAGGVMCGIVGKELGKYLQQQDYENIATVIDDPKPQTQTWCSGTRGFGVKPTNGCGDKHQVTVTTRPMSSSGDKQCRDYLTEVRTTEGEIKTVTANSCQDAANASLEMKQVVAIIN